MSGKPEAPSPECRLVEEDLSALLAGDLPGERRQQVDQHLSTCSGCSQEVRELRWILHAMRSLPVGSSLQATWSGIERQLAPRRAAVPRPLLQPLLLSAGALLLVALLVTNSTVAWELMRDHLPGALTQLESSHWAQMLFLPALFSLASGSLALLLAPILFEAKQRHVLVMPR